MSHDVRDEPPLPDSIWQTLRRDEPDPRAVQAAYLRFAARRPGQLSVLGLLRWLAAGLIAGWGVAFAATGDPLFGAGRPRTAPVEAPLPGPSAPARARPARAVLPSPPDPSPPNEPPAAAEPSNAAARPVSSSLHAVLGERSAADPRWQRVATALKLREYETAERALLELETSGNRGDRDAASLALAQVLLTRGRSTEARERLERLRAASSSALVREKAKALLGSLPSKGERSFPGQAVPQ